MKIDSCLSYISPVLAFLNFFSDLRVNFLVSIFLLKHTCTSVSTSSLKSFHTAI